MLDDFVTRAVLAGTGVAVVAGPIGAFVLWRRMAYFADATSHAAILGVALALALSLPVFAGVAAVALVVGVMLGLLTRNGETPDATLGVLAYSGLALGLVAVSLLDGVGIDIASFLFGDILTVPKDEVGLIWFVAALVAGLLVWRWRRLLLATLSEDLAAASGINPAREQLILTLALALVVAVSIKVVGALLIGALLIIPASAARAAAHTPAAMALVAAGIAIASVLGGLWGAFVFDTPAGPSMVVTATGFFILSRLLTPRRA